ncbi:RNA polymerase II transcription factor SIII subunit A-domain-containing protein, partial [Pyronema domesticum]
MMLSNEKAPKDLRELAERVLIKHKTEIESVGDISYQVVRAVLKTIDSAPQLKIIEKNSPHICAEDQELWRKLITKDFGIGAMSKYEIEDNNRWSALYDKHREEQSREHDRVADTMKKVMEATEAQKKTMTTKLDKTLVMPVKRTRGTNEGWGAGNNWDAKVGMKTKDIIKKSKIEADQVALRNKSANKKPIARTQINSSMAEALRMRHQNRVELTTNTSKKRTRTEDAPAPTPAKRTRTTELDSRNQLKTANKEDRRQDNHHETRHRDNRPQQDRPQQDRQRNPKTNARVEARRQRMHSEERDERDERRHERSRSGSWEDQIWAERREPPRHEQPTGSGSMARFLTPPERNGRNDRSNERRQDDRRQPLERNGRNDNRNERRQDDRRQDSRRNDNERRQDQHRRNDNRQHPYRR